MSTPITHEAAAQKEYDFIVVGAGAGATVAARLAENPNFSVLLVEAGKIEQPIEHIIVPLLGIHASSHPEFNWQYQLTPQQGLNDRIIPYPRGKAIGGTFQTNILFALRGPTSDWDRLARDTGDEGWSWENMLPFAKKLERFVPPTSGWDYTQDFDTTSSGADGPIRIAIANQPTEGPKLIIEAAKKQGIFNTNVNDGEMMGVGWLPGTNGGGIRSTPADYLATPKSNLDILTSAQVTKILFDTTGDIPVATGVEYARDASSPRFQVKAKKEVIISGGSIGSPHILLHSGIGDAAELTKLGIPIVKDLPDVGKHMQDHHILFGPHWRVNNKNTFDSLLQDQSFGQQEGEKFATNKSGLLANTLGQGVGFWRVPDDASIWNEFKDISAGQNAPHIEVLFTDGYVEGHPPTDPGNYFSCATLTLTPHARGSVTITSNDPFEFPAINPNLVGTKHDLYIAREAVKKARDLIKNAGTKDYFIEEYGALAQLKTDEEIEGHAKNNAVSCWHPTSTAVISAKGSPNGVLDPDMKVKGVKGLRVIDASVFPYIPASHTQIPVLMVAERGAHLIATEHS
ncbi:alcohol oxidase [Clavulina sp. PMI_390]|nr:alcohol oxidase [Clavulina sp. PMI_390]